MIVNVTYNPTEAIEGVLWSWRGGWITLKQPIGLVDEGRPEPTRKSIDGDVVIHASHVAYFQVVAAVTPT